MDFNALIDFTKYTLALAAAGFAYALEKLVPAKTSGGAYLALGVLLLLFCAVLAGVFVFGASTAALHGNDARRKAVSKFVSPLGLAHAVCLAIGMAMLGGMMLPDVLRVAEPRAATHSCSCALAQTGSTR